MVWKSLQTGDIHQEAAGKTEAFSTAVQRLGTLVKAWARWGDYLELLFTRETDGRNMKFGGEAITCYLHACRHQNESNSRKYLAKVMWLLTYYTLQLELAQAVYFPIRTLYLTLKN